MERNKRLGSAGLFVAAVALGGAMAVAPDARAGENKVEGTVAEVSGTCPDVRFKIGGQVVATNASTRFEDGGCADVKNGRRVEVEGTLQQGATLLAREVDFD